MKKVLSLVLVLSALVSFLYAKQESPTELKNNGATTTKPYCAKGLYVSYWAIGGPKSREKILNLIDTTEINSVVIDIKSEFGYIAYKGDVPLAKELGAYTRRTIRDIDSLMYELKKRGVYTIARIVVFKDDLLAKKHPEYSIFTKKGQYVSDREKLAWTNPFVEKVHDYNIEIAKDAILKGFDEVNFDYIRFPASTSLVFNVENNETTRVNAITSFLKKANKALKPLNAQISIDTYGYTCWNEGDTGIGQDLEELVKYADIISPMLYPSGFQYGIPNYKNPVQNSYETINHSLEKAYKRTNIDKARFRPWLQAFRDYGFDKRKFNGKEIRTQIDAAEDFGSCGWLLWHPSSYFIADGLMPEKTTSVAQKEKKMELNQILPLTKKQ